VAKIVVVATGAIDIGGTKTAVAVIDEHGSILAREETPTIARAGFTAAMDAIAGMLERTAARAAAKISGIGIACTGPVDAVTGDIGDVEFLPGWQGCNPVAHLSQRFRVAVAMENDADAAALAEVCWGVARGKRSLISVTVGTGIGGGILLNGKLYRGVNGAHPEIGHHVIEPTGPLCSCGARGCWEILASGPAMMRRFRDTSVPSDVSDASPVSAQVICDKARRGEVKAIAAVESEATYLGIGLANLITLFAPEMIVLSGSVMDSADLFLPTIRQIIRRHCGLVPWDKVEVSRSALGRDAPLIGASVVGNVRNREAQPQC
jgi:glucokinase